ncbi:MAG TPA: phosphotransferase [Usitatibacter sp.]|nr:phosphotransferase [Usitatibacter sp.]
MAQHPEAFLHAHGLAAAGEAATWTALTGGVSSEIWRVDLPGRSLCVKRALPRLRVSDVWEAPLSRNAYEWKWLLFAAEQEPHSVPRPLAHDDAAGVFAMDFLPSERYPLWKAQLLTGEVDPGFAAAVGARLARLHNASAARPALAGEFDSLENFRALRLEPYLLATAARHPEVATQLRALAASTEQRPIALVHGDVSPKNILAGPDGPVFLDAECAWFGDPAFDIAFCLNHLMLKALVLPGCVAALRESFDGFVATYLEAASFEPRQALEGRAAALLPGLMLARIDGKSPVEYLVGRAGLQERVRDYARRRLLHPQNGLRAVAGEWFMPA